MVNPLASYELILLEKLKNNDKSAFTIIFTNYYKDLVRFSIRFTKNYDASEEIVQTMFVNLWEERSELVLHTSLKSYLLKSVQNRSIDWLRHVNIKNKYTSVILDNPVLSENETENYLLHSELELNLAQAMKKMPAQYAEVFRMSRVEFLNYCEISLKLGVSVRTVEVRMAKAISILREELIDFLLFTILMFHFIY